MERIDLQHLKDLQHKASAELTEMYNRDIECKFGIFDPVRTTDLLHLVVHFVDDNRMFFDTQTRRFLDAASSPEELKNFKMMYDIFELEQTRSKILDIESQSHQAFVMGLLSIELGTRNIELLQSLYRQYQENDQQQLLEQSFYTRQSEVEKYRKLTKFIDLDADGIDDRIDLNNQNSKVGQVHEMDRIEPYSDREKQKEQTKDRGGMER